MNRFIGCGMLCVVAAWAMATLGADTEPKAAIPPTGFEKQIVADAAFLAKLKPPAMAKRRGGGPSVSISKPDACGKVINNADMIKTGANITVNGGATVSKPAEPGDYTFNLSVRVTDDATKEVIRDVLSQVKCAEGNTVNIGYLEHLKKCYCDAKTMRIAVGVVSISPSNKSEVLYYDECTFTVAP